MKRTVLIALMAGLTGGLVTRYLEPTVALAQDRVPVTKEVRAQSFTLVDSQGAVAGTFAVERSSSAGPVRIVLRDPNGRALWSAGGSGFQPAQISTR